MRASVDMYEVKYEGRIYKVLKFPKQRYMYVYHWSDCYGDNACSVDASMHCFPHLRNACAMLANDPDVIIYFPAIQDKEDQWEYCGGDMDLVMYRPELQFKRSRWNHIRRSLNKSTYKGRYVYNYDPEELKKEYDILEPKVRYKYKWKPYRRNLIASKTDYADGRTVFSEGQRIYFLEEFIHLHNEIIEQGDNGKESETGYADRTGSCFAYYISDKSMEMILEEKQKTD